MGENREKWLFSKTSLYSVTKIPGPPLVPDPSFIRFWYFFQTLRLFANLRLLERLEYTKQFVSFWPLCRIYNAGVERVLNTFNWVRPSWFTGLVEGDHWNFSQYQQNCWPNPLTYCCSAHQLPTDTQRVKVSQVFSVYVLAICKSNFPGHTLLAQSVKRNPKATLKNNGKSWVTTGFIKHCEKAKNSVLWIVIKRFWDPWNTCPRKCY